MKLLFVTPYLPSPPRFGGQRRLAGLMRSLAARHELSVLSFNASDEFAERSLDDTRSYCREVVTFPDMDFRANRDKRLLQARSLFSRHSFEHLLIARRREVAARLQSMIDVGGFDVVQVEFAQMAALRPSLPQGRRFRTVLDEHNIEYDIVKRTADAEVNAARRLYSAVDWRKLKHEERGAWRRFDGVCVTSQRDATILSGLEPGTKVAVVPNGVDVDQFRPSGSATDEDSLLFFGAMNYYPNQDGINYFLEQIFPLILQRRPQTKLSIVGPGPDSLLRLRGPNVEVTGFVDKVEPYLDRASVVIVPLRLGGGTRLKIVEAMSKRKAIVSTRIGAEGLDVRHDEHALLADDPASFAAAVERALADAPLRGRLGVNARSLAEERYSWPGLVRGLEGFYEQLLREPAKR